MGLGGVAIAALPSVVHLQLTFSDRLGGYNARKRLSTEELAKRIGRA